MSKYAIAINEETMDLVTFLNDGFRPPIAPIRPLTLICEVNGPREITTKIEDTLEVFGEEPPLFLFRMK
jgi:hypothetical protein